ncbi:hypothetical protein SCARR_04174 [Pontiella sulfatireligans]|uniref:Uncharacterized protein n=1 Tax=Pontiella sulfatireligans TaxID=2750658 RepID=A0A6C2UQ80_9BACT|nr:hypothetical protein SCARR_04174 [Pontiella sulfatireligans]
MLFKGSFQGICLLNGAGFGYNSNHCTRGHAGGRAFNRGGGVKNNYVLIDYENVQPKNLEILKGHEFIVKVFVGNI